MKPAYDKCCTRHWKYTLGKSLQVMQDRWFSSPYGVTQLTCRILTGTKTRYPTALVSKKTDKSRQGSTDSTSQLYGPVQSLNVSIQYMLPDSDLLPNCGTFQEQQSMRQTSITHITEARECRRFSHFTLCPNTTPFLRANDTQHLWGNKILHWRRGVEE